MAHQGGERERNRCHTLASKETGTGRSLYGTRKTGDLSPANGKWTMGVREHLEEGGGGA